MDATFNAGSSQKGILFLFTKLYPYGNAEKYIHDEIPFLSNDFEKIYIIPCELFRNTHTLSKREIPVNSSVFYLNNYVAENDKAYRTKVGLLMKIMLFEFLHEEKKALFLKNWRRYYAVLKHEIKRSFIFTSYLNDNFKSRKLYFYTYWLHHSSIMLGIMKKRGSIRNFVSRAHAVDLYHNDWVFSEKRGILPFQHFKTHAVSLLLSISEHGKSYLDRKFKDLSVKFKVLYLGVKDNGLNPYERKDQFVIVSCSSVQKRKRLDRIIDTLNLLDINIKWIHFGDGPELSEIKRKSSVLKNNISVMFKGFVQNNDIILFYKENTVNLFLNTSEAEGIPVSAMEAISFGIPVMAMDVYGNKEIANGHTGFLLSGPFNPEKAAELISEFAVSDKMQLEKRKSARQFYLDYFSDRKNFTKMISCLYTYQGSNN